MYCGEPQREGNAAAFFMPRIAGNRAGLLTKKLRKIYKSLFKLQNVYGFLLRGFQEDCLWKKGMRSSSAS